MLHVSAITAITGQVFVAFGCNCLSTVHFGLLKILWIGSAVIWFPSFYYGAKVSEQPVFFPSLQVIKWKKKVSQKVCVHPPDFVPSLFVVFVISGVRISNLTTFGDFFFFVMCRVSCRKQFICIYPSICIQKTTLIPEDYLKLWLLDPPTSFSNYAIT